MSILRISTDTLKQAVGGQGLTAASTLLYGLESTAASIQIMKGVIPTQTQLNNITHPFRSTDVLISVNPSNVMTAVSLTFETLIWNIKTNIVASQTGTASWFLWFGTTGQSVVTGAAIVGTITAAGGGGDMTLTDVNIVSGSLYTFGPAQFNFSRDFTY